MSADWRLDRVFIALGVTSLLVKLALVILARHDAPVLDEVAYLAAAEQIARGEGFPGTFRPPGYPAFVAALLVLGAGTLGVRLVQVGLSMVSVWSAYRLGDRLGGQSAARVAAAIVALDPVLIAFTHRLWSETLFLAILLVAVDLLTARRLDWPRVIAAGLLLGLGALVRPMILTFVPFLALWFIANAWTGESRRASIVSGLSQTLVFTIAALAIVAPWTARNARVTGTFVLVDSNGPFNVLVGAEPATRFVDKDDFWSARFGMVDERAYVDLVVSDTRRAQNGAMEAALTHIRSDPSAFVAKSVWEAGHLWTLDSFLLRHLRNGWYRIKPPTWAIAIVTLASVLFSVGLCLAGTSGLVLTSGSSLARLGVLFLVHSTLLFGATYALSRYAVPLRPMLALGAASLMAIPLFERWRTAARWQRTAVVTISLLLIASWVRDLPLLADMVTRGGAAHRFEYIQSAGPGSAP